MQSGSVGCLPPRLAHLPCLPHFSPDTPALLIPACLPACVPVQFPGLISGCTIDWYLPWPEEALTAVSSKLLDSFPMECTAETRAALKHMMASVHVQVTAACQVGGIPWLGSPGYCLVQYLMHMCAERSATRAACQPRA